MNGLQTLPRFKILGKELLNHEGRTSDVHQIKKMVKT